MKITNPIEAIRQRRNRRQQFNRWLLYIAGMAAITATAIASFAATRSPQEPEAETERPVLSIATEAPTEAATGEAPTEEIPGFTDSEAYMLARMAMAEAEGEDTKGKALVIRVILNRIASGQFPDTVSGVIAQVGAFTSYHNGRYDRVEPSEDCQEALRMVEGGWDESQGALYFERNPPPGKSTWHSRNLEKLFVHGNHTFYREAGQG